MSKAKWIAGVWMMTLGSMTIGANPCFAATETGTRETGYQITSTAQNIDVWNICKKVKSSSLVLFAPTKTADEWSPFLTWANNNPNKVTINSCCDPTCPQANTVCDYLPVSNGCGDDCGYYGTNNSACPRCCCPDGYSPCSQFGQFVCCSDTGPDQSLIAPYQSPNTCANGFYDCGCH